MADAMHPTRTRTRFTELPGRPSIEHKTLDAHLLDIAPGDTAAMARFEDALREHIHKEDNGLFPAAAIALGGDDWVEVHAITPHSHGPGEPLHTH